MRVLAERVPTHKTDEIELPAKATGMDLLKRLNLSPDAHLLIRGERPIPVDEPLTEGEHLVILAVVSGGSRPFVT